jgi:hypothetical protein
MAAVFAVAAVAKLADLRGSREAVADFGVPRRAARWIGLALPLVELCIAGALLTGAARWGALGAAVLLAVFADAMAWNLSRGRSPECHCLGQVRSAPASWRAVARNVVLAAVALAVFVLGPGASLGAPGSGT